MNLRPWSNLVLWIKPPNNGNLTPQEMVSHCPQPLELCGHGKATKLTMSLRCFLKHHLYDDAMMLWCYEILYVGTCDRSWTRQRQTVLTKEQELSCWELCLSSSIRKRGRTVSQSHGTLPELRKNSEVPSTLLLCKRCITIALSSPRGLR